MLQNFQLVQSTRPSIGCAVFFCQVAGELFLFKWTTANKSFLCVTVDIVLEGELSPSCCCSFSLVRAVEIKRIESLLWLKQEAFIKKSLSDSSGDRRQETVFLLWWESTLALFHVVASRVAFHQERHQEEKSFITFQDSSLCPDSLFKVFNII